MRLEVAGPRGKSNFAKQLGLSPSTYDYYEFDRVPPAEVLIKIAKIAGVDLCWLLTGETEGPNGIPADHPVLKRAAAMLSECPNAAGPMAAFLDVLAESLKFPTKKEAFSQSEKTGETNDTNTEQAGGSESWIPVLGRSAAGVPAFWADKTESEGLTTLRSLVEKHAKAPAKTANASVDIPDESPQMVQFITLKKPKDGEVAEFVSAGAVKAKYPRAFAVRIDGESMSPEIRHGDIIICSPDLAAVDGQPAVVQLEGQIGVTCKLYRRSVDEVHLVPVNEQIQPQCFPVEKVLWALRVLAKVRVNS